MVSKVNYLDARSTRSLYDFFNVSYFFLSPKQWHSQLWYKKRKSIQLFCKLSFSPHLFCCFHSCPLFFLTQVFQYWAHMELLIATDNVFLRMGSSQLLCRFQWSREVYSHIRPSFPCHLLPLTGPYVCELQLTHLSCALF